MRVLSVAEQRYAAVLAVISREDAQRDRVKSRGVVYDVVV
jgi:hypothetical protein